MSVAFIGFTMDVIGTILLAVSVILTHARVIREQQIDKKVIREMKLERVFAILGLLFIIIGYLLQIPSKQG